MTRYLAIILLFLSLLAPAWADAPNGPTSDAPAFFLRDGDTVVFYGDSITEQQQYPRDVETYVLTRFPAWHVRFINSGWNGDRVTGGQGGAIDTRLKRDVIAYKPTVVTVLLGMNDGAYTHYDQAAFDTYAQGLIHIVETLQKSLPDARLTLLMPTMYDENAPGSRHFHGYNAVLIKYGKFVQALGAERGLPVVDLNFLMHAATEVGRKRDRRFALAGDGVHPTEAGQLVIAAALLKAWHAPAVTADLSLTAGEAQTTPTALPWPIAPAAQPAFDVSPLPGSLSVFRVRGTGLTDPRYTLYVDNTPVATLPRERWEEGVSVPAPPSLAETPQAERVCGLVQDRLDRWRYVWKGGPNAIARRDDGPDTGEIAALTAVDRWLDASREEARLAAQPQPHTFVLRPAGALVPLAQSAPVQSAQALPPEVLPGQTARASVARAGRQRGIKSARP